jgi:ParB/RepB/Spo0J family partition protein
MMTKFHSSNVFLCESTGREVRLDEESAEAVRCGLRRVFASAEIAAEHQKAEKQRNERLVHRDAIYANPQRTVRRFSTEAARFFALMESIRENGVMQPLLVNRSVDYFPKLYELRAGYRRLIAAERVGEKRVPITILENNFSPGVAAIVDGIKEGMKPLDLAAALKRLQEEGKTLKSGKKKKLSYKELSQMLGIAKSQICEVINLPDRLHPSVAELLETSELSLSKAKIISQLPKVHQVRIIKQAINMDVLTLRRFVRSEKEVIGTKKPGRRPTIHVNDYAKTDGKVIRLRSVAEILDTCADLEDAYFAIGVRRRLSQKAHLQALQWALGLIEGLDSEPSNPADMGRVTRPDSADLKKPRGAAIKKKVAIKLPKVVL